MTMPRQVLPDQFYMLTRRCAQRQFLLRPDAETNNAFVYCLAEAAQRFQIDLIASQQMSNHHHTVLFDRYGRIIEFTQHFHKMLAKCQNALRGRWENMWSIEPPCIVQLVDVSDVIDKIVYVATNPVLDDLVDCVAHWPGARTVHAMLEQRPIVARRPAHFFRKHGSMPETASLSFVVPLELGDRRPFDACSVSGSLQSSTNERVYAPRLESKSWGDVEYVISRGATRPPVSHDAIFVRALLHAQNGRVSKRCAETASFFPRIAPPGLRGCGKHRFRSLREPIGSLGLWASQSQAHKFRGRTCGRAVSYGARAVAACSSTTVVAHQPDTLNRFVSQEWLSKLWGQ